MLRDSEGDVAATEQAPCTAFEIRLTLSAQSFSGGATLLSAEGNPVSRTLTIGDFDIREGEMRVQSVDFPTGAMNP